MRAWARGRRRAGARPGGVAVLCHALRQSRALAAQEAPARLNDARQPWRRAVSCSDAASSWISASSRLRSLLSSRCGVELVCPVPPPCPRWRCIPREARAAGPSCVCLLPRRGPVAGQVGSPLVGGAGLGDHVGGAWWRTGLGLCAEEGDTQANAEASALAQAKGEVSGGVSCPPWRDCRLDCELRLLTLALASPAARLAAWLPGSGTSRVGSVGGPACRCR